MRSKEIERGWTTRKRFLSANITRTLYQIQTLVSKPSNANGEFLREGLGFVDQTSLEQNE
jgi:hypothetical protein